MLSIMLSLCLKNQYLLPQTFCVFLVDAVNPMSVLSCVAIFAQPLEFCCTVSDSSLHCLAVQSSLVRDKHELSDKSSQDTRGKNFSRHSRQELRHQQTVEQIVLRFFYSKTSPFISRVTDQRNQRNCVYTKQK